MPNQVESSYTLPEIIAFIRGNVIYGVFNNPSTDFS